MREFLAIIFPYRYHLEQEIEYLKGQLAQEKRRIVELQDKIVLAALRQQIQRPAPAPVEPVKPRDWQSFKKEAYAAQATEKPVSAVSEASDGRVEPEAEGVAAFPV
jgi:hypothetical protein